MLDPALQSPYGQGTLPVAPPLQEDEVRSEIQADVYLFGAQCPQ